MASHLTDIIADQWRGLKKFAADLAAQLPLLPKRGNRGVKANLAILEAWIRAALVKLAEQIELPAAQGLAQASRRTRARKPKYGGPPPRLSRDGARRL